MTKDKEERKEEKGIVQYRSKDGQEIRLSYEIVRRFLVSGHPEFVSDAEILLYMAACKAKGMNPFKRDCYLIKYTKDDPAATIVSIDYYRSRAKAQDDCVGWQSGIILKNADTDKIEFREGSFLLDGEELVGGWFKAKPRGWNTEYTWTVGLARYIKTTREGRPTHFWEKNNQAEMIAKVGESQGLRRCWPDEFAKLYIEEEIVQGLPTQELQVPKEFKGEDKIKQQPPPQPPTESKGEPQVEGAGQPVGGEKKKESEKEQHITAKTLIDWLETAPKEEIMADKNYITENLKNITQDNQAEVVKTWNHQRQKILKQKDKEGRVGV